MGVILTPPARELRRIHGRVGGHGGRQHRADQDFTLDVGNVTNRVAVAAVSGQRLTGLFQSTTRVQPGEETGGPLVNLSGQVIGIDVAGAGSGLHHVGFAVPINEALTVARQIQSGHDG